MFNRSSVACWLLAGVFVVAAAPSALAQVPSLSVAGQAAPGTPVVATITGTPGHAFALVGSTLGGGFSFAGQALAVGADVAILAIGTLNGSGVGTANFTPPFRTTTVDRYYVQAATSPTPAFATISLSTGRVIVNGDLVTSLTPPVTTGSTGTTVHYQGNGWLLRTVTTGTTIEVQAVSTATNRKVFSLRYFMDCGGSNLSDARIFAGTVSSVGSLMTVPVCPTNGSVVDLAVGESLPGAGTLTQLTCMRVDATTMACQRRF